MVVVRVLAVTLVAVALLAAPSAAKNGVRAKLDRPVRLDTAPGHSVRVAWHLVDQDGRPFRASGIYLRVSRCGRPPLRVPAVAHGDGYTARVTVPRGGIRKLLVGLPGWRYVAGKPKVRADAIFAFVPPVYRDCPASG